MKIPFNIPYSSDEEISNIIEAIKTGHLSGNGPFTLKCHRTIEERYGLIKCFLTTSCTDALEMAAMLIDIRAGDEIIMPSFTFVSTALAFTRHGAVIRFIDSRTDHPGINEEFIEKLINKKTRAIVPVHYAGVACDMDKITCLASKYNLYVIEDAAHGIESFYKKKQLGSIGHLGCFSFHETKNIHCGEGGMLVVNDPRLTGRAEIIWEKGTNRAQFFRKEVPYYDWKDTGSSFLPSEINAAFLYAQLKKIDVIQNRRLAIWDHYNKGFRKLQHEKYFKLPRNPEYSSINGNSFYLICRDRTIRDGIISHLSDNGIMAVSHYLPLHKSEYYRNKHDGRILNMSEIYSETLVRFPIYYVLSDDQVDEIIDKTNEYLCGL